MRKILIATMLVGMAVPASAQSGVYYGSGGPLGDAELIINGNTVLGATTTGAYTENGRVLSGYFTGDNANGINHNSFFVFDLPDQFGPIFSAALRISSAIITDNLTINFFDYVGATSGLLARTWSSAIYEDLASGNLYGSRSYLTDESRMFHTIDLNRLALSDMAAAGSGYFAFGGSLGPPEQAIMNPEPISMILLGSGLAGVGAAARRRRKQGQIEQDALA